jgi:type II secretory pathway pseudopilin PulG
VIHIFENPEHRFQSRIIMGLAGMILLLLVVQFTSRSSRQAEVERAQVMLKRIYDLEQAYFAEHGAYLPIDSTDYATNSQVLLLHDAPGVFRYRVVVTNNGFTAFADADLNRDGRAEIWQIDSAGSEPIKAQED